MKIYEIPTPFVVSSLEVHDSIKQSLLESIEKRQKIFFDNVSNTDWMMSKDLDRDYVKTFLDFINPHMKQVFSNLGYSTFEIGNIWFQQYEKNSFHSWHMHPESNFTNIYYLELPLKELSTQIKNPMNRNEFIDIDVKEGDILTMPAHIVHRSPKNIYDSRKTIISFNCTVDHPK